MTHPPGSKTNATVWVVDNGQRRSRSDRLATEEPLELRLAAPTRSLAVTMRTPGADFELAAGFLYSEGLVSDRADIRRMDYCQDGDVAADRRYNIVNVQLRQDLTVDLAPLERHFYTTSACGVCGKTTIEALRLRHGAPLAPGPQVSPEAIYGLPEQLQAAQGIFQLTGGLHAAALFDSEGQLLRVREDVGRHNALDKLVGAAVLAGELPWHDRIVMVSGRCSFELVQKCIAAGGPILCAVSAPSSLAIATAREFGLTAIGFLRGRRFNIYTGAERIQ